MDELPDTALVRQARGGDKEAFSLLAERYRRLLQQLAFRLVGQDELAQDLVQETLLQAFLSLRSLHDDQRFRAWLYGIALNVCRSYLRSRHAHLLSLESLTGGLARNVGLLLSPLPDPHEIAEQRELHALIRAAIDDLGPKDRAATLLFYYQQLSVREVAALLGISTSSVKVHLHNARALLRARLGGVEHAPWHTPPSTRRRTMVPVRIADMVKFRPDPEGARVVLLFDEARRRLLPIWIGRVEADAIVRALGSLAGPRPMTLEFFAKLLDASGATLEEVRIETLKSQTFYAVARLRAGAHMHEIDARPSDALGLAALLKTPIQVSEEVFAIAGLVVEEGQLANLGHSLHSLIAALGGEIQALQTPRVLSEAEQEQWYQELAALLSPGLA